MKAGRENVYLGQDFKKRIFPKEAKRVEMHFEETPLFKAQVKGEEAQQLNLFEKGEKSHEENKSLYRKQPRPLRPDEEPKRKPVRKGHNAEPAD